MHFSTPKPESRAQKADDPACFDLSRAEHYAMVMRMYRGRFSTRVQAAGIDAEDGFQAVLEGLIRKSQSERSRWNPARGSLSTWLFVAMSGLCINMAQAAERQKITGVIGQREDAAEWPAGAPNEDAECIQFEREPLYREPLECESWPALPPPRFRDIGREVVRVGARLVRARERPEPVPYQAPDQYPPVERFRNRAKLPILARVQLSLFERR